MNTYHSDVAANGVEIIDASDMVEDPLDLTICNRRVVEEGRMGNDVEISNSDGWAGSDTVILKEGNKMKGQALVSCFQYNNVNT